jgi:CRISPR type III-B/RAMP module-associated protein Cmr3
MPDYLIKPYDVLFFRGNKSFHFGQWFTEGVFPPYPSTFQGFIRNKLLVDAGFIDKDGKLTDTGKAKDLVGDDSEIHVDIIGPYLMKRPAIYFQTPADLCKQSNSDKDCDSIWGKLQTDGGQMESDLDYILHCPKLPEKKPEECAPPKFISLEELFAYRNKLTRITVEATPLTVTENRVGIGLDRELFKSGKKRTEDTMFYVTPYQRLVNDAGFYCHTNKALKDGALKLGSESHLVGVDVLESENRIENRLKDNRDALIDNILKTRTFRMILLQPGIFPSGWLPFSGSDENGRLLLKTDGLTLRLLSACTEAPVPISGYSMAQNYDNKDQGNVILKPLVNTVPAGAVYLFQITGGTDEAIKAFANRYDNKKIPNHCGPYTAMGFNHVILAVGPEASEETSMTEGETPIETPGGLLTPQGERLFSLTERIKYFWLKIKSIIHKGGSDV